MIYAKHIYNSVAKVNHRALQEYLTRRGWVKVNVRREDISIFNSPNNDPSFDLIVPLDTRLTDYVESIFTAVKKVALFENRDELQLTNDLIAPPADIVRFRLDDESTAQGMIPLKSGFDLLESARKSLLSAANDFLSPTVFHKRLGNKSVNQFIDSCFLGQSERGSYVASIICPLIQLSVEANPVQLHLFDAEEELVSSFTRSATKKLMDSIVSVKASVENNKLADYDNFIHSGISVNFLEALVEFNDLSQGAMIEISTTWAPTIPPPLGTPSSVSFTKEYIDPIKIAIDKFTPDLPQIKGSYVGKISGIEAAPDPNNRDRGEITFVFLNQENKPVKAKSFIELKDLNSALNAFENGRNVLIKGTLTTSGRQKTIELESFDVIQ